MKLVVDANAFISALLREGLSRRLLFYSELELVAPGVLLGEVIKHSAELREKFRGEDEEFLRLFHLLAGQVSFISLVEIKPYVLPASFLSQDKGDWLYFACCLYADAELWSNDKRLKNQRRIRVWNTTELAKELGLIA